MKKIIQTALFCVIFAPILMSQSPEAFSYQGVARNAVGSPLSNQSISLRITIIQGDVTPAIVYQESHALTTNAIGLFTAVVGRGTVLSGTFDNINWGSDPHFARVEIDETGGSSFQLISEKELLSVPYALHAENGGYWEQNANGIYHTEGQVGIGTANYETDVALTVGGTIHSQKLVITETAGGADFVFERDYTLPPLSEVKAFITQNKHLPEIPSAQMMDEVGLDVAAFNIKLLQKVEELTLYMLEKEAQVQDLQQQIQELQQLLVSSKRKRKKYLQTKSSQYD